MKKICLLLTLITGISYGASNPSSASSTSSGSWLSSGLNWVTNRVSEGITEGASSVAAKTITKVVGGMAINKVEIDKNKKKIDEQSKDLNNTKTQLDAIKKDNTETKNKLDAIKNDNTETKNKLDVIKNDNIETKNKLNAIKKDNTETNNKLAAVKNDHAETKNKLETVKNDNINIKAKLENKVEKKDFNSASNAITNNAKSISALNSRIDRAESKFNKGLSLMAAMSSLDFGTIPNHNDVVVAAAVGNYAGNQAVALGLAMEPTDRFGVNLKYSVSSNDINTSAIGIGARYRFSF